MLNWARKRIRNRRLVENNREFFLLVIVAMLPIWLISVPMLLLDVLVLIQVASSLVVFALSLSGVIYFLPQKRKDV